MLIGINGRHLGANKTGVGRYLFNILRQWGMNPRGHRFIVYYSDELLQSDDESLRQFPAIELHHVPRPWKTHSFHLWYNFSLPQVVKRDKIDFFFSPDYFLPPLPATLPKSLSIHDVSYLAHPEWFPFLYRVYCDWYSKRPAKRASTIFTISDFSKKEIQRYIGVPEQQICVTPLGVESQYIPTTTRDEGRLQMLGITGPFFLFVGKIVNRRHVQELIEAFERYLPISGDQTVQLVMRGTNETHPHQDIEGLVERLNTQHGRAAVLRLPYTDEPTLTLLFQTTAAFWYLSTYEGFGLPVLEALACGTPTVTVAGSSLTEVAGDAAVFVDPKDGEALTKLMQQLFSDSVWRERLRERALKQAAKFSWKQAADLTLDRIEKLMA